MHVLEHGMLPQMRFSTDGIAAEHRFEAWRQAMSRSHEVTADAAGFSGRLRTIAVDRVVVSVLDSAPLSIARTPERIRRDGLEHFVLHLSAHAIRAQAGANAIEVPAGAISVNDLARPTSREAVPETGSITASISRDLLREMLGTCDDLHGRVVSGGAAALLGAHLRHIVEHADTIPVAAAADIAQATVCLLAACLKPGVATLGQAAPAIDAAKRARAQAFIEANLGRADLSAESIGHAVGLSRSTLFRVFEPLGGVAGYVWGQRLNAMRRALLDLRETRPIGQIGYAFGFSSDAHLSRAFRKRFGMSPRECRQSARAGAEGFGAWFTGPI